MRKPRDFDAALKTLTEKTKALKETKRRQLGDLIVATGADSLDIETLAGGLVAMAQATDTAQKRLWKKQGEEFFRKAKAAQGGTTGQHESSAPGDSLPSSPASPSSKS